jgi:DinB family protein
LTDDLRYPVGKFHFDPNVTPAMRRTCIAQIRDAPAAMRAAAGGLSDSQLDTPYRPEGWTVRQVVHHVPDSHLNAYCRFKLALTEDNPQIKPYDEGAWAKLEDTRRTPVETSLALLESLHQRWVTLLESMNDRDFGRRLRHPEAGEKTIDWLLQLYAWHGRHHVAHITSLRQREGW